MRDVYKPVGHWKKHQFWGVMNLPWEDTKWSILNKINTNYKALPILISELNRILKENNSKTPLFIFTNIQFGSQKFYDEYYRMIYFIKKNKEKIFLKLDNNTGSRILNSILKKIRETSNVGDNAEKLVVEYLPSMFSRVVSDIEISNNGEKVDMVGGVDISFTLDGISKTIQVKKCKSVLKGYKNKYQVLGTSISKHYNVDYIVCVSKYNLTVFEYNTNGIEILSNGDLKIDENLLVKNKKLNK